MSSVSTRHILFTGAIVQALACKKPPPDPPEQTKASVEAPSPTVPPVAMSGVAPVSDFLDAGAQGDKSPYDQALAYQTAGQHWLARLVLERKALGPAGTREEAELLALICHTQGDPTCVDECEKKVGKKIHLDGGAGGVPMKAGVHAEPDSDVARARDLLLKKKTKEARAILEPKVIDGKSSSEETRLLRTICKTEGDRMCIALCDQKLR